MSLEMAFFVRLRHKQAKKMRPAVDQYMATNAVFGGVPFMVTDLRTYRRMDGRTEIRTDGRRYGQMDGRTDGWTLLQTQPPSSWSASYGRMDRRTDGQVGGRTGGWTNGQAVRPTFL